MFRVVAAALTCDRDFSVDHGTANSLNYLICHSAWHVYQRRALEHGELLKLLKRRLRLQARRLRLGAKHLFDGKQYDDDVAMVFIVIYYTQWGDLKLHRESRVTVSF